MPSVYDQGTSNKGGSGEVGADIHPARRGIDKATPYQVVAA